MTGKYTRRCGRVGDQGYDGRGDDGGGGEGDGGLTERGKH